MLRDPSQKYRPFQRIALADRQWPSRTILKPPIWCSVDLRDGNQALIEPMDAPRKMRMFRKLVDIGFKDYDEHAVGSGADAAAVCCVELRAGESDPVIGVGMHRNILTASLNAITSAVNRAVRDQVITKPNRRVPFGPVPV
jgi:LeuA allosteric (dimerisation) domain/HMGL-like